MGCEEPIADVRSPYSAFDIGSEREYPKYDTIKDVTNPTNGPEKPMSKSWSRFRVGPFCLMIAPKVPGVAPGIPGMKTGKEASIWFILQAIVCPSSCNPTMHMMDSV